MPKYKMPAMLPLCLAVLVSQNAMALGLGPASLDSELGEPLFARIPIFRADGLGSEQLLVTLSPVKDDGSGIEVGSVDTRAISAVGEVDLSGNGTVYLRSDRPLVEPFLHFMLTVRWPNGSLSRAYTLLFDPPVNAAAGSAQGVSALQNINRSSTPAIASRSESRQARPLPVAEAITAESSLYTTVRGDSLWTIALRLAKVKSGSVTLWMDRLYANNPAAFIRGNRNLLKERVTLDLFESIPEPLNPGPQALSSALPKIKKTEVVATSSIGNPGDQLGQDKAILNRREDDGANSSLADGNDEALTEKQFLQQSLVDVRSEVDRVSENITEMTARLAALQTQLEGLNNQYSQLRTTGLDAELGGEALSSADEGLANADITVADADVAMTDELLVASTELQPEQSVAVVADTTLPSSASSAWQLNWRWLLPLAAFAFGLLLWVRRRREEKDAAFNVDLSDVNAAVAARANTKEAFNDVFSSLDSHSGVVKPSVSPLVEPTLRDEDNESDVFDSSPTPAAVDEVEPASAVIGEDVFAALNLIPNDSTEAHTDELFLDSADAAETISIDEIELDDELFANLNDDPAPESDEADLVDFDLSAIDDDWLTDSSDDSLHAAENLAADGDASHRAAAALELGDFAGAKLILEDAIAECDDVNLTMQLLDVFARSNDAASFEEVALQIQFSDVDDEIMHEVDLMRALLHDGHENGKRHAD
ncbi:hypothetical protein HNQ57_002701 [Zhongshania antarctica]|uniref:FimV N-terminal domain-containing protein n=1 Tax=Zhongshania antarctica TaxID=641702 RepID=A0A840R583_9GAMM|nr:hypothetical protein [Zhongshania antarctica]MBB5188419.1 hypothetical protein [Zhongshania antarctica]